MKFHNIEMVGKLTIEKVDSLPSFNASTDEGRLLYNLGEGKYYFGESTKWSRVGGEIPDGDAGTATPDAGAVIYDNGSLYYGDGVEWKEVGAGGLSWQIVSSNTTLEEFNGYLVNCSSSPITLTFPSSPDEGDLIAIKDFKGNAGTNNITLNRNGNNIEGNAANFIININNNGIEFVYTDSSTGWTRVYESYGPAVYA